MPRGRQPFRKRVTFTVTLSVEKWMTPEHVRSEVIGRLERLASGVYEDDRGRDLGSPQMSVKNVTRVVRQGRVPHRVARGGGGGDSST